MFGNMFGNKNLKLSRDCAAVQVPWGGQVTLPKGKRVAITQQSGGSFTVKYDDNLYRIDGKDVDALGKELPPTPTAGPTGEATRATVEKSAWEQLATCYDPEIPINIVALGLVYACAVIPMETGLGFRVIVHMTLTAPGCGMADYIAREVREKLKAIPGVAEADVQLVWDPPWSREHMSEAARLAAGLL